LQSILPGALAGQATKKRKDRHMAETKTIEAIVAEKGKKEGEGGADAGGPPKESEVGGRYRRGRYVICPHCGFLRYIVEETRAYQWYTCGNCGGHYYF
jgi:hypothetical protein